MKFYTNALEYGNNILVRGYDDGVAFSERVPYKPRMFVPSKKPNPGWHDIRGLPLDRVDFESMREAKDFIQRYEGVTNFSIYGLPRFIYCYLNEAYPDEVVYDRELINVAFIDIEVSSEFGFPEVDRATDPVISITLKKKGIFHVWGLHPYETKRNDVFYHECKNEKELLVRFLSEWAHEGYPDIISGWNVTFFDIPYLYNRIRAVLGETDANRLSPWKIIKSRQVRTKFNKEQTAINIGGIATLDYLEMYQKFTYTQQESYRLDHIASVELGQKKLDHSEYETFKEFYTQNWQKFVEYNIVDVELVDRLEDKMKLIELAITMAYDAKVNYVDVFYQVRMWDNIIFNYLKKRNIVIPPKERTTKSDRYAGAYVKEPKPGVYDWVVSFDLNSLYPHLIMQYNISPETLLDHRHPSISVDKILNKELDFSDLNGQTVCANGALFDTTKRGFLPELMEKIYKERTVYKKKMLAAKQQYEKTPTKSLEKEIARCNNIQMARKIQLNSAYGAIGNQYFRYYKLANAEAITLSGQVSIRWIENKMNSYLNKILKTEGVDYVIASDTDSIYLNMGPFVETIFAGREKTTEGVVSFLDKVCKLEFEKYIESSYQELAEYVNAYDQKMQMKRENIADRGIWTAKKRYILNVWDSEGVRYEHSKLKIMGLEAIKSSTPAPCRKMIKDALRLMVEGTEDDVIEFIDKCRRDFKSLPAEDISFPRSVSEVTKYHSYSSIYGKGTPIHARGALLYNHYVKEKELTNKYSLIQNGEKIKFCYLKKPNPIHENVISFIQTIPKEFDLDRYIDYNLQFEKSFLEPLRIILDAIGWRVEKSTTLESFFM